MPPVALLHPRESTAPPKNETVTEAAGGKQPPCDTASIVLDRAAHAAISYTTDGLSPAAMAGAFFDWWVHLAFSSGKQLNLAQQAIAAATDNLAFAVQSGFGAAGNPLLARFAAR